MSGRFYCVSKACDLQQFPKYNMQQKTNMRHFAKTPPLDVKQYHMCTIFKHWFMEASNMISVDCVDHKHKLFG